MKNKIILLLLLAFVFATSYSQDNKNKQDFNGLQKGLSVEIVFGVYNDDQYNHTFDAKERKWILKNGKLIYKIDAQIGAYSDTIKLTENDLTTITNFVKENNLTSNINKNLNKDYLNKYEHTESIKGQLKYNNKIADFNIITNSSSSFDEDTDAKLLKKLENLLYKIIENYKK